MDNTPLNNNERTLFIIACRWYKSYCRATPGETWLKDESIKVVIDIADEANIKLSEKQVEELSKELRERVNS